MGRASAPAATVTTGALVQIASLAVTEQAPAPWVPPLLPPSCAELPPSYAALPPSCAELPPSCAGRAPGELEHPTAIKQVAASRRIA